MKIFSIFAKYRVFRKKSTSILYLLQNPTSRCLSNIFIYKLIFHCLLKTYIESKKKLQLLISNKVNKINDHLIYINHMLKITKTSFSLMLQLINSSLGISSLLTSLYTRFLRLSQKKANILKQSFNVQLHKTGFFSADKDKKK